MSYADGQYPTCDHEAHITREVLERWWVAVGGNRAHPLLTTSVPGSQAIALQIEDLCDADD